MGTENGKIYLLSILVGRNAWKLSLSYLSANRITLSAYNVNSHHFIGHFVQTTGLSASKDGQCLAGFRLAESWGATP